MKEKQDIQEGSENNEVLDDILDLNDSAESTPNETKKDAKESPEQELDAKLLETQDKYIRLAAEFDNFRKRSAKERLELINTAGEDIIKGFLPVLDDCQRAVHVLKDLETDAAVDTAAKEGIDLIYNKLFAFLKTRGLALIDALGKELDTDFHEAIAQFPVEDIDKKNKIIDVAEQGYMLHDKVIRFAKVVVGV